MKDFFWNVFEKSGSIEALLAYREFYQNDICETDCEFSGNGEFALPYSV